MTDDERGQWEAQVADLAAKVALLKHGCRKLEWGEAEAMALVLSHEATIETQRAALAELEQERDALRAELRLRDGNGLISGLVAHLSDRVDVLCKERDALREELDILRGSTQGTNPWKP